MLSVPIPQIKENFVDVRYFPYDIDQPHKILRINVGEYETIAELRQQIVEATEKERPEDLFVGTMQKKDKIDIFGREHFVRKVIEKNNEIVAYER